MKKGLRERLKYVYEVTESQEEENIIAILKTVIQEWEGTLDLTDSQKRSREFNRNHQWRKN